MSRMTPKETIAHLMAQAANQGSAARFTLLPVAPQQEVDRLGAQLGVEVPDEIRDLLEFTSGVASDAVGRIDFTGGYPFAFDEAFPISVPILPDGYGNCWLVDIEPRTGSWGPVFFVSHDPPVVVVQSRSLSGFLMQALGSRTSGERSSLEFVKELAGQNLPGQVALNVGQARQSSDQAVRTFAGSLAEPFAIFDLRELKTGSGFSLWRPGFDFEVVRCEGQFIWAVRFIKRMGLLARLFG